MHQLLNTTVVFIHENRVVPSIRSKRYPKVHFSANYVAGYARFGREENLMAICSMHIPSAIDTQLPQQ